MDELLLNIKITLDYISNHTSNVFIISTAKSIDNKLDQIRNRKIISKDALDYLCEYIIDKDINKMKRVISIESSEEYKKLNELEEYIKKLNEEYFINFNNVTF